MKRTKLQLILMCLLMTTAQAYTIYPFQIFVGSDTQTNPDIDGDVVVWQSGTVDVYWTRLSDLTPNMVPSADPLIEPWNAFHAARRSSAFSRSSNVAQPGSGT